MLVLSRKENESILIPAIETKITLINLSPHRARVGIEAPTEIIVIRSELEAEVNIPSLLNENEVLKQRVRALEAQLGLVA